MKSKASLFYAGVALFGLSVLSVSTQATPIDPYGPWYPSPNGGSAVVFGQQLFATGGDVTVTFLGPTGAAYDEQLFVASPANGLGYFFDNHTTAKGAVVDLGTYAAGTEIIFGLYVATTGNTWYSGPGSRNSDGYVHAYMVNNYEGIANVTYVGFEDLLGSIANWDYIDEPFAFSGTTSGVPEIASTASMLGLGLGGLMTFRRFKK